VKKWLYIIIVFSIILSCFVFEQTLTKRCFLWNCPPNRNFTLMDLELNKSILPSYVTLSKLFDSSENEGAIDSVGQNGYWGAGQSRIIYNVWQFGNTNQATIFVSEMIKNNGNDNSNLCKLEKDFEVTYQKYTFHSDENTIVCGYGLTGGSFKAFYQASYEEYVISFMATLDGRFTIGDFFKVLDYIDNQMIEKLGQK
jgi:hypothetical protein